MAIDIYVVDEQTAVSVTNQTFVMLKKEEGGESSQVYLRIHEGVLQYTTDNVIWKDLATVQLGNTEEITEDIKDLVNQINTHRHDFNLLKNRPFYDDREGLVLLGETLVECIDLGGYYGGTINIGKDYFEIGKTYTNIHRGNWVIICEIIE
jgi:hypothetical protein